MFQTIRVHGTSIISYHAFNPWVYSRQAEKKVLIKHSWQWHELDDLGFNNSRYWCVSLLTCHKTHVRLQWLISTQPPCYILLFYLLSCIGLLLKLLSPFKSLGSTCTGRSVALASAAMLVLCITKKTRRGSLQWYEDVSIFTKFCHTIA
jgi:hypothetical protein